MPEVLIILAESASAAQRDAVAHVAPPAQTISGRVFTSSSGDVAKLRSMPGVAAVLSADAPAQSLPPLSDSETLFAQAWLSRAGQPKQRPGDGLKWDAPGMIPPDPPRER